MCRVGQEMSKNINQQPPFQHYRNYFIAAAVSTAIAGIVHLYIPFGFPVVFGNLAIAIFFLGSGIAQIIWILPMLKRWGKPWYYIGIVGNLGLIILYVITLLPGNPVTGRSGNVDITATICESGQVAYIVITATILAKERHRIQSK
jgi:hypothetical protein